ncbi:uncharacterized protein LOC143218337 [Lasioglossum baleicum]|uniref:uncharacterized protein LOC143218337 n=1 Tax=Lasioglossum baleicum TaxID=434251 RepID=UPI003FCE2997
MSSGGVGHLGFQRKPTLGLPLNHQYLIFLKSEEYQQFNCPRQSLKLVRVLAYCLRFVNNARIRNLRNLGASRSSISASEVERVETLIFKQFQGLHFPLEINQLSLKKPLAKGNRLAALNPFIAEHGLVRVGGRLCNAPIEYNRRHPIILPNSGAVTTIIIRQEHLRLFHAGLQQTLSSLHVRFWIIAVTKAVHIELAAELSTDAFIRCLHRFISRRGRCNLMYSDNGKNFVGASNELNELGELFSKSDHRNAIMDACTKERIEWHFIPPYAPHFGGLWERGIRSVKLHLKRYLSDRAVILSTGRCVGN